MKTKKYINVETGEPVDVNYKIIETREFTDPETGEFKRITTEEFTDPKTNKKTIHELTQSFSIPKYKTEAQYAAALYEMNDNELLQEIAFNLFLLNEKFDRTIQKTEV